LAGGLWCSTGDSGGWIEDDRLRSIEAKSKSELCRRAEKIACQGSYLNSADLAALSPEESRQVLHDLQVHQIELELQNEELLRVQEALVAARERYATSTISLRWGTVQSISGQRSCEANLTVAKLLNVPRAELVGQPMTRFIFAEDQDVYYHHRQQRHNPDAGDKGANCVWSERGRHHSGQGSRRPYLPQATAAWSAVW
jgi:PAS domain-containing protein